MALPHLLVYQGMKETAKEPPPTLGLLPTVIEILSFGYFVGLFYLNAFVLTRRFLYNRKYLLYLMVVLGLFVGKVVVFYPLMNLLHQNYGTGFITYTVGNFLVLFFFLSLSTSYQMIRDKFRTDRLAQDRQKEHLKTELSFLRSQISPHFMFNVLNNIVALVRMKSDKLEPTIFKLSSLDALYALSGRRSKNIPSEGGGLPPKLYRPATNAGGREGQAAGIHQAGYRSVYHRAHAADPVYRKCF